jgi:transposase
MRFVPVKSAEAQADAMILSVRELLVKQHTQLVNALRGHASEFGVIAAKGTGHVEGLLERIAAGPAVPAAAQAMFVELGERIAELHTRLAALDRKLAALHKACPWAGLQPDPRANPLSQQLAAVPGIGPIGATSVVRLTKPDYRHANAWLLALPQRRPRKLAAVAPAFAGAGCLANKMARVVWAMMTSGEAYRPQPAAG